MRTKVVPSSKTVRQNILTSGMTESLPKEPVWEIQPKKDVTKIDPDKIISVSGASNFLRQHKLKDHDDRYVRSRSSGWERPKRNCISRSPILF